MAMGRLCAGKVGFTLMWLTLVWLTLSGQALAFEALPQFRGLTPHQARSLDRPEALDSEYSSDHLTYQKPLEWERLWLSQDIVFDLSTGSLDGRHFQTEDRLKLQQSLYLDLLDFRFTYLSQSDLEERVEHHVMELLFSPFQLWGGHQALAPLGISLYGETALYKAENNFGLALVYRPPQAEHRLFANFPQFAHNKRHTDVDFFDDGAEARAYGLYGHWWHRQNFLRYTLRYEPRARWIFPQDSEEYHYLRQHASLWWQWEVKESTFWAGRAQVDSKQEGRDSLDESTPIDSESITRRRLLLQSQLRHWWRGLEWTWGLSYYERRWRPLLNPDILQRDLMPHFWLALPEKSGSVLSQTWSFGLEMTHHRRNSLANEYRLNIKYALDFHQGQSEMNFLFTFDLDEFGTERTWEGGAIQFRSYF